MKTSDTTRRLKPPGIPIVLGTIGVTVLAVFAFAQTLESGQGKERASKPGESQRGPKSEPPGQRKKMEAKDPPPMMVGGKIKKMEDELGKPPTAGPGEKQAPANAGAGGGGGQGGQKNKKAEAKPPKTHLKLAVRITPGGETEVIRAVEVPGDAVYGDEPIGDHVYEVEVGGQPVAAEAMINPFENRSYPSPTDAALADHHTHPKESAVIIVKVPNANLNSNLANVKINLHKIKDAGTLTEKINPATIRALKQQNRLEKRAEMQSNKLSTQVKAKGKKLPADQS